MNEILNIILSTTYTQNQLNHKLKVLRAYLLKALFGGQDMDTTLQQDLSWFSTLPKDFFKNFTKDNVYKIFDDLEKLSSELKVLTIYLSTEITENIVLQVGSYARKTYQNPMLLLDTKFDPLLLGGAAFVWKGVYRDYSLREKIESKKEQILQGFQKYLK